MVIFYLFIICDVRYLVHELPVCTVHMSSKPAACISLETGHIALQKPPELMWNKQTSERLKQLAVLKKACAMQHSRSFWGWTTSDIENCPFQRTLKSSHENQRTVIKFLSSFDKNTCTLFCQTNTAETSSKTITVNINVKDFL